MNDRCYNIENAAQRLRVLCLIRVVHGLLLMLTVIAQSAYADVLISETFSGSDSVGLVEKPTPDGNEWSGATTVVESTEDLEAGDREKSSEAKVYAIRQDGTTAGTAFTAYHEFKLQSGCVYTLAAGLSPANKFDNQWFAVGFAVKPSKGDNAPQIDGCTTYGQSVLSGSGYRYGWIGPNTESMCELHGPELHAGAVKVILDTSDPANYTIELFDGEGKSMHGPSGIGTPPISQVFLGCSGTDGRFTYLKLTETTGNTIKNTKPKAQSPATVVMLGDSTTDQGLSAAVKKQFDRMTGDELKSPKVINAGKGGDNATGALERLDNDVLKHKPDIVTVSFGLNDVGRLNPEQYETSLKEIVAKLKAANIKVVLMTSTPFNNERHFWATRDVYREYGGLDKYLNREFCDRMRNIAKQDAIPICDLHAVFQSKIAKQPKLIDELISRDGVHLTAEGLELMASQIVPVLTRTLNGN